MVWCYTRGNRELQVDMRYDEDTSEFVVRISAEEYPEVGRYKTPDAFTAYLAALERQLLADGWRNAGPPLFLPDEFPRPLGPPEAAES